VEELTSSDLLFNGADITVVNSFSAFLFDKTEQQIIEILGRMQDLTKKRKSFVLSCEGNMLTPRISSYLRSVADSIVIIKTDFIGNKINRMLYIPKAKGGRPMSKLLKITLENNGIQIDTRELIG
jgi:archaellum biogenesis ATPase FlaH